MNKLFIGEYFWFSWPSFEVITENLYSKTKRLAGVYLLMNGQELIYVGKTRDLYVRWVRHKIGDKTTVRKDFDTVFFVEIQEESERKCMEIMLIENLKPKYNRHTLEYFRIPTDDEILEDFNRVSWESIP